MKKKKLFSVVVAAAMLLSALPLGTAQAAAATPVVRLEADVDRNFSGADNMPYAMQAGDIVGTHFSIAGDATFVGFGCPSWSDNVGSMTVSLYTFDTDYDTSVSNDPIATNEFVDFQDNGFLGFEFAENDPLKAGEYVLEVTDAYDDSGSGVGVWAQQPYEGQRFYENGEYNPGLSLRMAVEFITPPEVPYGTLSGSTSDGGDGEIDYIPYLDCLMRFSDDDAEYYYTIDGAMYIDNLEVNDEGYLQVDVGVGADPQFYIHLPTWVDGPTRDDYPVLLIRLKRSAGAPTNGELFFNTTEFPGPSAGGSLTIQYEDTEEWQNAIVNFKTNKNFTGSLLSLRYDIVGAATEPCTFLIDYILFFSSTEAAAAFKHEDLETMLANQPTPEPATPTPEATATPTKAATATPKATASTAPSAGAEEQEGGLSTGEIAAIVVCAVVVVGGIIVIIAVVNKRKKNGGGSGDSSDASGENEEKKE